MKLEELRNRARERDLKERFPAAEKLPLHPERVCNGGGGAYTWCGETATHVVTGKDGVSQWFACEAHRRREALRNEPIEHWFKNVGSFDTSGDSDWPVCALCGVDYADRRDAVEMKHVARVVLTRDDHWYWCCSACFKADARRFKKVGWRVPLSTLSP